MAITKTKMTEEEFLRLKDDGRKYELVDGEAKFVPAGWKHDIIGGNVIFALKPYAEGRGFVASSQAGFRMTSKNIRCPDVSFTLYEHVPDDEPTDGFADFAPDLCIEIISPYEDRADMQRKLEEYFASGAKQVWHMFPEEQRILVYTSPVESKTYAAEDEIDAGDLLPGFHCRVADLFAVKKKSIAEEETI